MRKHNLNYVVIGLFVSAMLVAVVLSVAMVTGRTGPSERYTVVFDNVADLKFGTQVRFEGFPIGQVEEIAPFSEGAGMQFRVAIGVREGWKIPTDSVARIGSSSILGSRTIDIERGTSETLLAPGGEIAGAPSTDIFSAITKVADEISDVNQELVRPLLREIKQTVAAVGGELQRFSRRLNQSMNAVQRILSPANVKSINAMVANFSEMSAQISVTARAVDGLIVDVDTMLVENRGNLRGGVEDFRYVLRSVAQDIDSINNNLAGASRNLNEFSRLIRQNPGLLLGGSSREEVRIGVDGRTARQTGEFTRQTGEFK